MALRLLKTSHILLGLFVALLMSQGQAQSPIQQLALVKFFGADIRVEPVLTAPIVVSIPAGQKVEFVQSQGPFWWKVKWQEKEGWVLRALLERVKPDVPQVAQFEQNSATKTSFSPLIPKDAPLPKGQGKALVFGISEYENKATIPTLPGVPFDMVSASSMAQMMGISKDQITVYRDQDLRKEAMVSVLTQLAKEVKPDQAVLIYYSGHGGRIDDTTVPGRCIEGLVTYEGQLLTSQEMAALLRPIAKVTDNLFVFIDSCHSGGLSSTRALNKEKGPYTPKFYAKSNASNCSEIVNMLSAPESETRATGNRFVYAGAARPNEISLDDARSGGVATSNWLKCMAEGDNAQTVEALRLCTQDAINRKLEGSSFFKAQNLTITGDLSIQPMRANLDSEVKKQLVMIAATSSNQPDENSAKMIGYRTELQKAKWPVVLNLNQALDAVTDKAASRVKLAVDIPDFLKINGAPLAGKITAPSDGYLYIFLAPSDGAGLTMLFPNAQDKDNLVRRAEPFTLPRANWPLISSGPEGTSRILFVFSEYERDLTSMVGQFSDPFFDIAVSPLGLQAFNLAMSRSAYAQDSQCAVPKGTKPPAWCSASFVAMQKNIREIR